eukprot:GHVQ01043650.1.p1 GENE.GHVQ01043650.1~~GHVQ01043650.1.p1  ORF type:complete len:282 (+),score=48.50 GHVQ01043650.1:412-1257(+)
MSLQTDTDQPVGRHRRSSKGVDQNKFTHVFEAHGPTKKHGASTDTTTTTTSTSRDRLAALTNAILSWFNTGVCYRYGPSDSTVEPGCSVCPNSKDPGCERCTYINHTKERASSFFQQPMELASKTSNPTAFVHMREAESRGKVKSTGKEGRTSQDEGGDDAGQEGLNEKKKQKKKKNRGGKGSRRSSKDQPRKGGVVKYVRNYVNMMTDGVTSFACSVGQAKEPTRFESYRFNNPRMIDVVCSYKRPVTSKPFPFSESSSHHLGHDRAPDMCWKPSTQTTL